MSFIIQILSLKNYKLNNGKSSYFGLINKHFNKFGKKMRQNSHFIFIIVSLIVSSSACSLLQAQESGDIYYITSPSSKLWIDGTSNIDSFTCKSQVVNGYAEIGGEPDTADTSYNNDKVIVSVSVKSLNCGNGLMNNDMYDAMKADKYPAIKYELLNARLSSHPDSSGWFTLNTFGKLFIAGKDNRVKIKIKVKQLADGKYRLVGSKPLSMLNYGITPPSHFFGLIRAHDKLVVHFDLVAEQIGSMQAVSRSVQQLLVK